MPRPPKLRWVGFSPRFTYFVPQNGLPVNPNQVFLRVDELEAMRLSDLVGLSQEDAARRMNISRATFGRIVEQARRKISTALVYGKGIAIGGGDVIFYPPAGGRMGRGPYGPHGYGKGPWH